MNSPCFRGRVARVEGGHIRYIRVAMGGVGTKPWRSHEAEAALLGKAGKCGDLQDRGRGCIGQGNTAKDNAFKVELARRCLGALAQNCNRIVAFEGDSHGDGHTSYPANIIGAAVPRIDGPLKTTGTARYASITISRALRMQSRCRPRSASGSIRTLDTSSPRKCRACCSFFTTAIWKAFTDCFP